MGVLVVKGSGGGGLGDALRSVLVGINYAHLTDRELFVDWRHGLFADKGVNAFPLLFSLHGIKQVQEPNLSGSVWPVSWKGRVQKSLDEVYIEDGAPPWNRFQAIKRYSFDMSVIDYPYENLFMWEFDQLDMVRLNMPAEIKGISDLDLLSKTIDQYISLSGDIRHDLDALIDSVAGQPLIGVHIRMTKEFSDNKGGVDLKSYYHAIDAALISFPDSRLFLATDNINCYEQVLSRYSNVLFRDKWFAKAGDSLHLNDACPDKLQATKDALIEMYMLGQCDAIVCPEHSSFSMISRIIGRSHGIEEYLVAPGRDGWLRKIRNHMKGLFDNYRYRS